MGRWDSDDPQDEHDINELRKWVHEGKKPQMFPKGSKSGKGEKLKGCNMVLAPVGAIVVALAWLLKK